MNTDRRYRLVYKPVVFVASLVPLLWLICATVGWLGQSLGADPVKKLEHELGQLALKFLVLTLLVTPLRQLTGWIHLVRLRRMLGLFAFFYALLHFTVYVVLDLELNLRTVLTDIVKRPYITIGFFALLLLIPLAVTSTNAMMRRLGRRWQTLHRLIYVIAILAVWHFWWQVKKDIREPLIYAAIIAVLLGYRLWRARSQTRATLRSGSATAPEKI
jgi:sulfoxide reductase heme-binding subunit YedZ